MEPIAITVKSIFADLTEGPKQTRGKLVDKWEEIVGERIAKQTTPKFTYSGVTVWTDTAALASELIQKHSQAILKRLQHEFGEERVKRVWFSVGTPRS